MLVATVLEATVSLVSSFWNMIGQSEIHWQSKYVHEKLPLLYLNIEVEAYLFYLTVLGNLCLLWNGLCDLGISKGQSVLGKPQNQKNV
jgi:uncharacterized membrane protein